VGVSYVASNGFENQHPRLQKAPGKGLPAWIDRLSAAQYNTFEVCTRSHDAPGPYHTLSCVQSASAAQRAARPGPGPPQYAYQPLLGMPHGAARTAYTVEHRRLAPQHAGANTWGAQISELFIKIRPGYQWLDLVGNPFDFGKTPTCTKAKTTVYESPSSNYTLAGI